MRCGTAPAATTAKDPALGLPLVCAPNISTVNWQPQSKRREELKKNERIETKEVFEILSQILSEKMVVMLKSV